jgi:signal transduction histidine kinase
MRKFEATRRPGRHLAWLNMTTGWVMLLVLGVLAVAGYYVLPQAGVAQAVILCVVNTIAACAALVAAARTRGLSRIVWLCLGLGMTLSTLANVPYYGYPLLTGRPVPFPCPVDALWLLTYPCFVAALLALAKHRRGDDHVGDVLDTMILTAGSGALIWVFMVAPAVHSSGLSPSAHVVAALYPTMDVFVFAALIRLLVGAGRNDSIRLLVMSFVALLLADAVYAIELGKGTYHFGGPTDGLWMLSYLLIGVAARHPAAGSFQRFRADAGPRIGRGRLLFLGVALLVGPVLLATRRDEVAVVASTSMASFLLVMTRMMLLNRRLAAANNELAQRTEELRGAQAQLVDSARQAGMAEIATNVLHNVGNVLNSVNVSANLLSQKVRGSKAAGLGKAVALMGEHADDLGEFLTTDARGKQLPNYLGKLATALAIERQGIDEELVRLTKGVAHIKEIVSAQQSLAGVSRVIEVVQISDLMDDGLRIAGILDRHDVTVTKDYPDAALLSLDRYRILLILVNLIKNSSYAMHNNIDRPRALHLRVELTVDHALRISVADNGAGISPENLTRIFVHGFTTHSDGHGFGLHSSALAAGEMGGTLTVHSDGVGTGAIFTLEVPLETEPLKSHTVAA